MLHKHIFFLFTYHIFTDSKYLLSCFCKILLSNAIIRTKGGKSMAINYSVIGLRLKQARLNKKITQEVLAEKLNVSVAYISRIERGSTNINLKRLSEICALLGVSEGEILSGTSSDSSSYLNTAFSDLLKNCPTEKIDLIYKLAKVVIEN